jgi:prepilin-type N-terminal cleavage/methylation domain-containing protein
MMNAIWKRRNTDESGFTLVELLVVIAILGILAAVAVFAIGGTTTKSKAAACKADVATVQTASDAYYAEKGSYAASISALKTNGYLRNDPSTKTVAADGYALVYTVADGSVSSNPANCAVA